MTDEQVVASVETAFSAVPYPGDDSIVTSPTDWEGMDVRADFSGKHWHDIIEPNFLREHNLFVFFTRESFRFYLPAYLIGLIRFPEEGIQWAHSLLIALYPPTDWENAYMRRWDQWMKALTLEQKQAIRRVLEHLLERDPRDWWTKIDPPGHFLELALANYWNQF
jgi:hypothetical protein